MNTAMRARIWPECWMKMSLLDNVDRSSLQATSQVQIPLGGLGNHYPQRIDLSAQPDRLRDAMGVNPDPVP